MSMNSGFEVRSFKEIDSTNTYLIEEAKQGARDGLVATAAFQTAGRGRQGRTWEAPEGSALLVSALLRPVMSPDEAHLVATAVALSARAAIEQLSGLRASLKWPNDLVVEAAKIAGILGEIAPDAPGGSDGSIAVVVGIGVNLSTEGPPEAKGTSVLAQTGSAPSPDELLDQFLAELSTRRSMLDEPEGRAALLAEARSLMSTLGSQVRVTRQDSILEGKALELTDGARLIVLDDAGERHVISVGDLIHLRPR